MDIINVTQLDVDHIKYMVDGMRDIDKDKAIREGLYAGGAILKRGGIMRLKMRMKSPFGVTGNLIKSFKVRVKRNKLGVLSGFGHPEGKHSWLIDQGTRWRHIKKDNLPRGYGPALGYWKDTRTQDWPKAMNSIEKGIKKFVNRVSTKR